ncbi:MAG: HupE/UreJ family protein, partial [Planktomarina sp.]|nr:HupE/UreJ family protein [Planktomarina sp.]
MLKLFPKFRLMVWSFFTVSSFLLGILGFSGSSQAHELRPAIADVLVTQTEVQIKLLVTVETLLADIDLTRITDTDEAPEAKKYDQLRSLSVDELAKLVASEWTILEKGMLVDGAGRFRLQSVKVLEEKDVDLPRDTMIEMVANLKLGDGPVAIGWVAKNGGLVVRHGTGDNAYAAFLEGGEISIPLPRMGKVEESAPAVFWRFVVEGFDHIIPKGLDHILFVFGLFLFSQVWRALLWQITAFTLAHTVTLGLATLSVIAIPPGQMWLVEALIAISIAYVAIENIFQSKLGWWRIVVVFCFGLLHGLGFASVLGDLGLAQGQFILS